MPVEAPAPAKTAPVAPTPAPTPAPPSPSPAPEKPAENPFAEIESAFQKQGWDTSGGKGDKKPEVAPEKPADKPKEPDKPAKEKFEEQQYKGVPPAFRKQYEQTKAEAQAASARIAEFEAKIKEFESKGKDTEALTKRLEQAEKDREEARTELALLREEPDQKAKELDQQFKQSADWAKVEFEKLAVVDADGNPVRKANWETDFIPIWNQHFQDPAGAIRNAKAMFGDAYDLVRGHISDLSKLNREIGTHNAQLKATAKERLEKRQTDAKLREQKIAELTSAVDKDLVETVNDYRDPPDDKELAEARAKAYSIMDSKPKSLQEAVLLNRHTRHMAAAFYPNRIRIARLEQQLAEAKAELDQHKNPQPKPTKTTGKESDSKPEGDWADDLRKHMAGVQ